MTRSEMLFEGFLSANGIAFRRLEAGSRKTPDYAVEISGVELIFEIKELADGLRFRQEQIHTGTVGEEIRKRIKAASKQLQSAAEEGKPTVLLIFNNRDPQQSFGTEDFDFEHAMYGELTISVDTRSGKIVDSFHGRNKSFQVGKNTSFSAVGRLKDHGSITVTLFENVHAKVPIDYDRLPACFEVIKAEYEQS